jgi:hypothetical protein
MKTYLHLTAADVTALIAAAHPGMIVEGPIWICKEAEAEMPTTTEEPWPQFEKKEDAREWSKVSGADMYEVRRIGDACVGWNNPPNWSYSTMDGYRIRPVGDTTEGRPLFKEAAE